MPRDPKYDILFEPIEIGPKTMKNRFYQTPHCTGFGSDRPGGQAYFRGMKAEGGWAVVNTEWCSIHPEADETPAIGARLWDDDDVRNLRWMCEKVHEQGALAGVELGFNGPHGTNYETRIAARGISQIPSDTFYWHSCYAMDKDQIRELQSFYVAAAVRAQKASFDIINIMGAEAAGIPQQFLMQHFNTRTDEYGGTFENRARFWLEILELVREAVSDSCAITARLCIDTLHQGNEGIKVAEEWITFIQLADHLVDFWDLQVGGRTRAEWGDDAGPSRFFPENFQRHWLQQVRPHTKKPIVGVGRFTNPDTMVNAIRSFRAMKAEVGWAAVSITSRCSNHAAQGPPGHLPRVPPWRSTSGLHLHVSGCVLHVNSLEATCVPTWHRSEDEAVGAMAADMINCCLLGHPTFRDANAVSDLPTQREQRESDHTGPGSAFAHDPVPVAEDPGLHRPESSPERGSTHARTSAPYPRSHVSRS